MKKLLLSLLCIGIVSTSMANVPERESRSAFFKGYDIAIRAALTAGFGYGAYCLINTPRKEPRYQTNFITMMLGLGTGYFAFRTYQLTKDTFDSIAAD